MNFALDILYTLFSHGPAQMFQFSIFGTFHKFANSAILNIQHMILNVKHSGYNFSRRYFGIAIFWIKIITWSSAEFAQSGVKNKAA